MPALVFNHVKHKIGTLVEQARDGTPDVGCLLLLAAGVQADDTLQDYTSIATLLAASNDEATFTGYARKILPTPVITVDNTLNRVIMTITGTAPKRIQWDNAGAGQSLARIVFYYDPTPGSSPDSALLPLSFSYVVATTDGTHLVVTLQDNEGFAYAANPA